MAVKIRFARIGTKNAPVYRIVATDVKNKRDGKALDVLGTYNPVEGKVIQFHAERIDAWLAKGALISDAVKRVYKMYHKQQSQ